MSKIYVKDIIKQTMVDGPGLRTSIYCSGCYHHCKGCQNPQTWDLFAGKQIDVEDLLDLIKDEKWATGVTFTGGDPLYQADAFTELAKRIKEETDKDIWVYTGYTMSKILSEPRLSQILRYVDYVVDGPFVEELLNIDLEFRGSTNQLVYKVVDGFPVIDYKYMLNYI